MESWRINFLVTAFCIGVATESYALAIEPSITTYGQRNAQAPRQLDSFAFLVGKWRGTAKIRLEDGSHAQSELTWIGRYILDGMAIADEFHALAPDGKPYLGISIRQFDAHSNSWTIEYLNISNSFIRRQVNPRSGTVSVDASAIVVISEDAQTRIREKYLVEDQNHFTYTSDMSRDGGRNWDPVLFEMTMVRLE
jgi:hypothetical protein